MNWAMYAILKIIKSLCHVSEIKMLKKLIVIFLIITNPLSAMENKEVADSLLHALVHPHQRDVAKIIAPYLTIMNNDNSDIYSLRYLFKEPDDEKTSPLRSLLQEQHDKYKNLPLISISQHGPEIKINKLVANIGINENNLIICTLTDIHDIDLTTGTHNILNTFEHNKPPTLAEIDHNGSLIVHGRLNLNDKPLKVFNVISKQETVPRAVNDEFMTGQAIIFSSDDTNMITASSAKGCVTINWFNAQTTKQLDCCTIPKEAHKITFSFESITTLALSPDNSLLVLLSGNDALSVFDNHKRKYLESHPIAVPLGNSNYITDICILPDNRTILAGSCDGHTYSHDILLKNTVLFSDIRMTTNKYLAWFDKYISRIYCKIINKKSFVFLMAGAPAIRLQIFEYPIKEPIVSKELLPDLQKNNNDLWKFHPEYYKLNSSIILSKKLTYLVACCPDKCLRIFDTRGFFNTIINRLAKLSFAQKMLLQAYDKLLAAEKTPVKIKKNTLEEKVIKVMDPLILEILLQEKVIELPH